MNHLCQCESCLRWVRGSGTPNDEIVSRNHLALHEMQILLDYLSRTGAIEQIQKVVIDRLESILPTARLS